MRAIVNFLYLKTPRIILNYLLYIFSLFYLGRKYSCSVCKFKARKKIKLHFGEVCPRCTALNRDENLKLVIDKIAPSAVKCVIHSAPEICFSLFPFHNHYNIIQIGFNRPDIKRNENLEALSFKSESCDIFIAQHVLEHVNDDLQAMREIFRILKPGGLAFLSVPLKEGPTLEDPSVTTPEKRKELFGQEDHVRFYGIDFFERLKKSGFQIKVFASSQNSLNKSVHEIEFAHYFKHRDVLIVCQKQS